MLRIRYTAKMKKDLKRVKKQQNMGYNEKEFKEVVFKLANRIPLEKKNKDHALDGEYKALNGSLGLCKQTQPQNDDWGASLRSALRSRPRYIMVGEIRTPEAASECLRAATSGHLVLSTIHAATGTDAIQSIVKYAA